MRPVRSLLPMLLAAQALVGCAGVVLAPAGDYAVGSGEHVTLGRNWSDMSNVIIPYAKKVHVLTIDGLQLNRLMLTDGLAVGDQLVASPSKQKPTPSVRAGMSATERLEFIADSVEAMGYRRVETVKPRPGKLGTVDGIRFDLSAQTADGLDILGAGLVAEHEGKLYVVLYLAPAEHYFEANLAEVEAIMASSRL